MLSARDQRLLDNAISLASVSVDIPASAPYPGADRYILASLLQKAIRRGALDVARRAGHQLLDLDPGRLWRRLRVAALEDIGFAAPEAAAATVAVACLPEARRQLGGNSRALDIVLMAACRSIKDRTADHLISVARCLSAPATGEMSTDALIVALANRGLDWKLRAHAASLLQEQLEHLTAAARRTLFKPLFETDLGIESLLRDSCEAFVAREREALPLFTLLGAALHAKPGATTAAVRVTPPADPILIDGIPDYAFDPNHTRIGRKAIDLWRRSHIAQPRWTTAQLRAAYWNVESAACDRRLEWELGEAIRREAYHADLTAKGVPQDQHDALYIWVVEAQPALACARVAAWRRAHP